MNTLTNIVDFLFEQSVPTRTMDRIDYAIKNRHPVTFYYTGPKESVKSGRRYRAEIVARGLSPVGNNVVRAWVGPPSTTKSGFGKGNWRTFIIDNDKMSSIQVFDNETFDEKRPGYKEGDDASFSVTYVTSDWNAPSKTGEVQKSTPTPEPKQSNLPQPKVDDKPTPSPTPVPRRDTEVFDELKKNVQMIDNKKIVSPEEYKSAMDDLYKKKLEDWKTSQSQTGMNVDPGEGTRRRFEKESESELYNLMRKENIVVSEKETEPTELQESINRIKTLIFF